MTMTLRGRKGDSEKRTAPCLEGWIMEKGTHKVSQRKWYPVRISTIKGIKLKKLGEHGKGDILIMEISDVKARIPTQLQKKYGISKSGPGVLHVLVT